MGIPPQVLSIALVYINTLTIQNVLGAAVWRRRMGPEDFRALMPLLHGHVNPYGTFELDMETHSAARVKRPASSSLSTPTC
jgi:hypothetical protein